MPGRGDRLWPLHAAVVLAVWCAAAQAQDDWGDAAFDESPAGVVLGGSLESQVTAWTVDGPRRRTLWYDMVRLRASATASLPADMSVRVAGVGVVYAGQRRFSPEEVFPAESLDRDRRSEAPVAALVPPTFSLENRWYLDSAYGVLPVGNATMYLGKQPLSFGAGYLWNPTNPFVTKDMLDPAFEQEGTVAARAVWSASDAFAVDAMVAAEDALDGWSALVRVGGRVAGFEVRAVAGTVWSRWTDWDAAARALAAGADPAVPAFYDDGSRAERWQLVGGEVVADVGGVRLWAEGAWRQREAVSSSAAVDAGAEYYFPSDTHLLLEYYYDGAGRVQHRGAYPLSAWLSLWQGDALVLGRHMGYARAEQPVGDSWTVSAGAFQSFSDGSGTALVDAVWNWTPDVALWFLAAVGYGGENDYLSATPFLGWVRATLSF